MKRYKQLALDIALVALTVYIGYFLAWSYLIYACDTQYGQCGDDLMTQSIRILYPFF